MVLPVRGGNRGFLFGKARGENGEIFEIVEAVFHSACLCNLFLSVTLISKYKTNKFECEYGKACIVRFM